MPRFVPNQPVVQREPVITVDSNSGLAIGAHRFRLVVVDDSGNESEPSFVDVIVQDRDKPTAVLDVVDTSGRRVDPVVPFGRAFRLSADRSSDAGGGRIVEFRFTLVPRA
jgi:hypothetical protein